MVQDPERESYVRELLTSVVSLPPGFAAVAPRETSSSKLKLVIGGVFLIAASGLVGLFIGRALLAPNFPAPNVPANSGGEDPVAIVNPQDDPNNGAPSTNGGPSTNVTGPNVASPSNSELPVDSDVATDVKVSALLAADQQLVDDLEEIQGTWEWEGPEYRMEKVTEGNRSTIKWYRNGEMYREHTTDLVLARMKDKRFLGYSMTFTFGDRKGGRFTSAYRYDVRDGKYLEYGTGKPKEWLRMPAELN
jgi:hypothetical protein